MRRINSIIKPTTESNVNKIKNAFFDVMSSRSAREKFLTTDRLNFGQPITLVSSENGTPLKYHVDPTNDVGNKKALGLLILFMMYEDSFDRKGHILTELENAYGFDEDSKSSVYGRFTAIKLFNQEFITSQVFDPHNKNIKWNTKEIESGEDIWKIQALFKDLRNSSTSRDPERFFTNKGTSIKELAYNILTASLDGEFVVVDSYIDEDGKVYDGNLDLYFLDTKTLNEYTEGTNAKKKKPTKRLKLKSSVITSKEVEDAIMKKTIKEKPSIELKDKEEKTPSLNDDEDSISRVNEKLDDVDDNQSLHDKPKTIIEIPDVSENIYDETAKQTEEKLKFLSSESDDQVNPTSASSSVADKSRKEAKKKPSVFRQAFNYLFSDDE